MRTLSALAVATLTSLATLTTLTVAPAPAHAEDAMKLVTVITSEHPQTQLMGMVLTMQSLKAGAQTHMLLCGPGGDLALVDAPASATAPQPPQDMSPQGLMKMIMQNGGTVEVCAIYLPGKGAGPEALLEGVGVAAPADMAARLMDDDTRVLSF